MSKNAHPVSLLTNQCHSKWDEGRSFFFLIVWTESTKASLKVICEEFEIFGTLIGLTAIVAGGKMFSDSEECGGIPFV